MEWYYILAVVAAFFGVILVFYWLAKKGVLNAPQMSVITNIVETLSKVIDTLADVTDLKTLDLINLIMDLVNKAVLAAENAWYNDEISKDERKQYCMDRLNELLTAYHIELTETQWDVIDILIKAFCEQMGHTLETTETMEITEKDVANVETN